MASFLSKLFGGSKSEKDIKQIRPLVDKINQYFEQYKSLSNDELRGKTVEFKARIKDYLKDIDASIQSKKDEAEKLPTADMYEKDKIYQEVDALGKERDKKIEEILDQLLPEAFAVMKETAQRFKDNEQIVSQATDLDRELAVTKNYIAVNGETAIYNTTWSAAGMDVAWSMVHYDVQLIGGIVLHQGKIAEMATGEGKTLVSTLSAYLNALAGEGVHIVTVNDYLSRRDSEWNGPLYEWLGLKVDCIDKYQPNTLARRNAYMADITYGTNNEFGFDYLRDNMVHSPDEMVQRKHHYAMVDEVDSVLIDDARTPLIISGPVGKDDSTQLFFELKDRVASLVAKQRQLVNNFLVEAKKKIAEGNDSPQEDGGGLALFRAHRGMPKTGSLIKFLSEPGMRQILQKVENYHLADQQREMPKADAELLFYIDEKNNQVDLTDKGIKAITGLNDDPNFFVLPNIAVDLTNVEKDETLSPAEKMERKEKLFNEYSAKTERIHAVQQLLKAYTLFEKDDEYVVIDGQVKIVDEQTGRIMEGRRYSDGLHQALEAKENVKIEAATQTYATITLQNYFRMYHKLSGMTGTAATEAAEFWQIYKLDVVTIPTNVPVIRQDMHDLVYRTKREKYGAVIDKIEEYRNAGRPILVGTTSVETSELLSRMLHQKKIPHNVLNAKQHAKEAQVVAEAGLQSNVTIATNMAGRGTDIKLAPEVRTAGGLAIIGTERHDSRRVDLQLRGRSGRQGDPGTSLFYVSLEDDLMRMFAGERMAKFMNFAGFKEGESIESGMITKSIERAQKKVEENNFGIRKHLLEYDDVMNKQRTVIYSKRNHALFGERLALDIDSAFYFVAETIVANHKESNDYESFKLNAIVHLALDTKITQEEFAKYNNTQLAETLYQEAFENYQLHKEEIAQKALPVFQNIRKAQGTHIENVIVPFTDDRKMLQVFANMQKTLDTNGMELANALEKNLMLGFIDEAWKEHLRAMDDLKQSVRTVQYEQKDPLVIYKQEAFGLFAKMNREVNMEIVTFLSHAHIPEAAQQNGQVREGRETKTDLSNMHISKEATSVNDEKEYNDPGEAVKRQPVVVGPKVGRNDPCPCGSGKKFKNCHGKEAA